MKLILSYVILACVLCFGIFQIANSMETGAPCTAIESMIPKHNNINRTKMPDFTGKDGYKFRFVNEAGDEVKCYNNATKYITVKFQMSPIYKFLGFAIQARKANNRRVGSFVINKETRHSRIHCDEQGAITHTDTKPKETRAFAERWEPENGYLEDIYFNATIATSKTIWNDQFVGKLLFKEECKPESPTCEQVKDNLGEQLFEGPYSVVYDDDKPVQKLHVAKGSSAVISGTHCVCVHCNFRLEKQSTYFSDNSSLKMLASEAGFGKDFSFISLKFQRVRSIESEITLTNGTIAGYTNLTNYNTISNITITDSKMDIKRVHFLMTDEHFINIDQKSKVVLTHSKNTSTDNSLKLYNKGCLQWSNSVVKFPSSINSVIHGRWRMMNGAKFESEGGPMSLFISESNDRCDEIGLSMLERSSIFLKNPITREASKYQLNITYGKLIINKNSQLEIIGDFKLTIDNAKFDMTGKIRFDATNNPNRHFQVIRPEHYIEESKQLDCTFKPNATLFGDIWFLLIHDGKIDTYSTNQNDLKPIDWETTEKLGSQKKKSAGFFCQETIFGNL